MAKSINTVTLMGNLTRDPQVNSLPSGDKVVSLGLALNRSYKDQAGEWQESTDYIDVTAFGRLAEQASSQLVKGSRALVQGRLQSRSWEKDGMKRTKVEVFASDITFIDPIRNDTHNNEGDIDQEDDMSLDLPFGL